MKAVQIKAYGGNEVLEVVDVPKPTIKEGQVLVEIHAASINPFDLSIRAGYVAKMISSLPITMGGDFSGVVSEVPTGVTGFTVGEQVYGSALILTGGSGAFAEYAAANTKNVAIKPKSATLIEAAALPLVAASVIQALEDHIKLQKGQKILIHGGAGGIGHVAIQVAKVLSAYVVTTVSTLDVAFAKSLGADQVIDFKKQDFTRLVKDVDSVFAAGGGDAVDTSFPVLKKGGILVSMLGQPNEERAKKYGVTVVGQMTQVTTDRLNRVGDLVDKKKVKVNVNRVFPLGQVREAFAHQETGHPRGKVVLQVKK